MNQQLKSLFIGFYPVMSLIGIIFALRLFNSDYFFSGLGLILLSSAMLLFLGVLFLTNTARTDANLNAYTIINIIGVLVLVFGVSKEHPGWTASLGFVLFVFWFLYIKWYSIFKERSNTILKKGQILPVMLFEDEHQNKISSKSLINKKSIWLFYRGNWCPLCMAQIKELVDDYKALEEKGIQTILISPQPHKETQKLADKFKVNFKFLVDKDNVVAKQLQIFSKNGLPTGLQVLGYDSDTVMPTVILSDEQGKIIHSDLTSNYRVRPEPRELMEYFA